MGVAVAGAIISLVGARTLVPVGTLAGHAIFVQPRTPFVQKQLLQELSPVSLSVQPLWTVSPPVSLHADCVVLGVFASEADKVPETFA